MSLELLSKPFGKIQIQEGQIIEFPSGLLGFETYSKFALIEEEEDSVFKWLQSVDELELAFVVITPNLFRQDYKPIISATELSQIGLQTVEDGLVLVIVTVPNEDPSAMTANLQGPILVNKSTLQGRQFISKDENHSVREKILQTAEKH